MLSRWPGPLSGERGATPGGFHECGRCSNSHRRTVPIVPESPGREEGKEEGEGGREGGEGREGSGRIVLATVPVYITTTKHYTHDTSDEGFF